MLPFLGPSNPRDAAGFLVDWVIDPFNIYTNGVNAHWAQYVRTGTTVVEEREKLLDPLDEVQRTSLDYYAAVRSLYRQRRDAQIRNSNTADTFPVPGMSGRAGENEQAKQ
jgi:phospholipid-binding lipoprotein MlaA